MYSLYRAWLSLTPGAILPNSLPMPNELNSNFGYTSPPQLNRAPDVSLQVGPNMTHFSAHKNILSAHSGFFKAVFLNNTGSSPIPVPNVNVDEFSSLLTFMYTGFLDLNFSNIYNILLATHILHMPRALEICRSFLIQHHPLEPRTNPVNIIKPIASRKSILPHQQIFQPIFGNLQKSEATPFRPIGLQESEEPKISPPPQVETNQVNNENAPEQSKIVDKNKIKKREEGSSHHHAEKVIIDVACCDGPVRFHRVLNKNYGLKNFDNCSSSEPPIDRNSLLNKIMNDSIRDKQSENENGGASGQDMFTCVYCNHTFKSQYCYQKHARRHLNPVCTEVKNIQKVENVVSNNKREVKLLDMNVQYYPCKTCGSKFPSYYFVHKHRKMCHADEVGDESEKSMEVEEKSNNGSNSAFSDSKNEEESEIEVGNEN